MRASSAPTTDPSGQSQQCATELRALWVCCTIASTGIAGHYLLDRGVTLVLALLVPPPIKLSHPPRRSPGPALGHCCFFGEVAAIAGMASPPLSGLFGSISGAPPSSLLLTHRPDDHCTPPVPSDLLRQRVLGRVGEGEFLDFVSSSLGSIRYGRHLGHAPW
ncbi:hypothetical protein NDU88_003634 [Pleurodeles waltl]|uniref:Uncharacterized protein n=1 Tax=Pleurodeles waltl TaxID=8319 RepID=A0AAV7UYY8_PLEWA|nr:hypothetical protein NDU88_003634 [Pleurodeles waltl]